MSFFFENIFSGIQLFYIRPHVLVDIFRVSSVQKVSKVLQHSQNLSQFTKIFQETCFCMKSEKTFALHRFLTPKTAFLKHFETKCPFISVYLRKKRLTKVLSDARWVGGGWIINFIKAAQFLDLVK